MSKKTDIIISAYNQAYQDANELLKYIESISTPSELDELKFPSLVRHLENKDSDIARIYIDGAAIMGGSVATAIGTSITAGMLSRGLMVGGAMTMGKIGLSMIPGLNLFTIPVLALPIAIKILSDSKIKKYVKENKKGLEEKKGVMAPIFFTVLVLITGIATWSGWYSIFIVVGLMINAICLAFSDAQKIRYFTMIKSPLCLIYNIIVLSGGGIFYECASIVSATLGIIRNRHSKMQKETGVKSNGNI